MCFNLANIAETVKKRVFVRCGNMAFIAAMAWQWHVLKEELTFNLEAC
jgi:hypothetical protein